MNFRRKIKWTQAIQGEIKIKKQYDSISQRHKRLLERGREPGSRRTDFLGSLSCCCEGSMFWKEANIPGSYSGVKQNMLHKYSGRSWISAKWNCLLQFLTGKDIDSWSGACMHYGLTFYSCYLRKMKVNNNNNKLCHDGKISKIDCILDATSVRKGKEKKMDNKCPKPYLWTTANTEKATICQKQHCYYWYCLCTGVYHR